MVVCFVSSELVGMLSFSITRFFHALELQESPKFMVTERDSKCDRKHQHVIIRPYLPTRRQVEILML